MRPSILAAVLLFPLPALADGDLVGSCFDNDTSNYASCPVNLTAGSDYDFHAVEADGTSVLRLLDPSGDPALETTAPSDGNLSVEVRAKLTGTYRLEVRSDPARPAGGAGIELYTDCRADERTRCVLAGKASGATTGTDDVDGWRVRLSGRRRHALAFPAGAYSTLRCDDGSYRQNHKGSFTVWPRRDTACLFTISRASGPYGLRSD